MKNGTEKYIETVAYLGKLYDFVNAKLFGGELIKPVITVQRDERNKTNGWWSVGKVWKWKDTLPVNCGVCEDKAECCENSDSPKYLDCSEVAEFEEHELNMTAQQLNRPIGEIAATLIHEMCHQFASINKMQDCSRSGTYHNRNARLESFVFTANWLVAHGIDGRNGGNDSGLCKGQSPYGYLPFARNERSDGQNFKYA